MARKKTAKKKPVRKTTVKKRAKPAHRKKPPVRAPKLDTSPKGPSSVEKLARDLKAMINKYLKMALEHTKYYRETKYWTDKSIDQIVKLGKELEAAQRQYLRMIQQFLQKILQ